MSRELQPPVPISLVKIELPTVIKNEPPESEIVEIGINDILNSSESEEEIIPDIKGIDIVYHPVCKKSIKSEILESKHCENVETQVLVKAEDSPFIKTENMTRRIKTEDTSDENVTKGTGQAVEIQALSGHSNALSNLDIDEQYVNFSKNLNGISRKSKSPKKKYFDEWEKETEKIKVIKAPVIPVEAHEYNSLDNDRHVCNHCQQTYKKLKNLRYHIRRMHRKVTTMYQCPYCSYKSKCKHHIKLHIILKHKDTKDIQWFQCHLCEKKFKLKYHLTGHMKVHLKPKQMQDKLSLREKIVEAHEYTSLAKDRHVCNHCQYAFSRLNNLKVHIKRMHREVTPMYQCPHCPYKSIWSNGIRSHFIQKHKDTKDIQWFQCHICEKKFKLKYVLTQHMKVHLTHEQMQKVKRKECDKCDYKTDSGTCLKRHMLNHLKPEDIPYFHCYHCSYKSKQKGTLKQHIFTHHFKNDKQRKRFRCNKCVYKSYTSTNLNRHKLTHLKPEEIQYFYCYHCSYKAKWKEALKIHIFTHFKKEQVKFDCYICNFMTSKRKSIIAHIKKHSKVQNKSEFNERKQVF